MTIDLVKARALCAAATPGPWVVEYVGEGAKAQCSYIRLPGEYGPHQVVIDHRRDLSEPGPDAAFIAAARTLLPEALESLEQSLARERDIMEMLMLAQDERDHLKAEADKLHATLVIEFGLRCKAEADVERIQKERGDYMAALANMRDHVQPKLDAAWAENARLRTLMRSLLNKVNRVTAPYRHGNPVIPAVLAELAQRQIDVEAALAAPQTGGDDV